MLTAAPLFLPATPALGASRPSPANGEASLRDAAEGFEALFLRQMLAAARQADFGGEALFGSNGEDTFTEMRDARCAEIAAEAGTLGIADMLEAQFARPVKG